MSDTSPASPLRPVLSALPKPRRANRLPIYAALAVVVVSGAVIVYGIGSRGLGRGGSDWTDDAAGLPASNFGDRLKEGVPDGIINAPSPPSTRAPSPVPQATVVSDVARPEPSTPVVEDWQDRLVREHDEQMLREVQRQQLAALQADQTALDAPIAVALPQRDGAAEPLAPSSAPSSMRPDLSSLYPVLNSSVGQNDPNQQEAKQRFMAQSGSPTGVLAQQVTAQRSPYELKRGSVIPAVLLTGINSDLPGQIIAQVSQNVFDSATGHQLLIPQGAKLLGQYDSEVSFGQDRVLVLWTDLVFPDGATLRLEGMAGSDSQGNAGFADQVDRHTWEIFGSALLLATVGAGVDMLMPDGQSDSQGVQDALRGNFAESFGEAASVSLDRNMSVQPTLTVRPGYVFNVIVEQDIEFSRSY